MGVVIHDYQDQINVMLQQIAPHLTKVGFRGRTALDPLVRALLPCLTQLRFLDLNDTSGCHEELLELIPSSLEGLSLQRCSWIRLPWVKTAILTLRNLHQLKIGENPDMDPFVLHAFLGFRTLDELDLRNLGAVNNKNADYVFLQQPNLVQLNLSWCTSLSDEYMIYIRGNQLRVLDLSHTRLGDTGLQSVGKRCPRLQQISIEDCVDVTEQGVLTFVRQAVSLRLLNARGLNLSPAACAEIRRIAKALNC